MLTASRVREICQRCPRTAELLEKGPGAKPLFHPSRRTRTFLRIAALAMEHPLSPWPGFVPKPEFSCRLRVEDSVRHWEEGKSLLFDDTFQHEAWADSDQTRVVLFMDVVHPLPFPISLLNSLVIKSIAASPFIRDAKKKSRRLGAPNERLMELNPVRFSARTRSLMSKPIGLRSSLTWKTPRNQPDRFRWRQQGSAETAAHFFITQWHRAGLWGFPRFTSRNCWRLRDAHDDPA